MAGRGSGRSVRAAPGLRGYWAATRSPLVGVAVTLPLLLVYNVGLLVPGNDTMNAADLLTRIVPQLGGLRAVLIANAILAVTSLVLLVVVFRRGLFRGSWWLYLCGEGILYGVVMGLGVRWLLGQVHLLDVAQAAGHAVGQAATAAGSMAGALGGTVRAGAAAAGGAGVEAVREVPKTPLFQAVVLSAGAGYWEELVFRLALVGGPVYTALRFGSKDSGATVLRVGVVGLLAVAASSVLFSALHYVGGQEVPGAYSFWYRTLAGVFFSGLFLSRGFAVAAWTHFLYDVVVMSS